MEKKPSRTPCECLDFVEAAHRNRVYPLMYCHMEILGHLDIERLENALRQANQYVPELFYSFDFEHSEFVNLGHTVDDILLFNESLFPWNLSVKPQLQININRQEAHDDVTVGMSHILTDGEGFLQFLYLLSFLYNSLCTDLLCRNFRELAPLLDGKSVQKCPQQVWHINRNYVCPIREFNNGTDYFCLVSRIEKEDFRNLRMKVKKNHAAMNDAFMAAYARVIARLNGIDMVVLPCPADLRRLSCLTHSLTVANLTGIYREVPIKIRPHDTFSDTLLQIHAEVQHQKSQNRCYQGITALNEVFHKMPHKLLEQIIKANYRIFPVSYTNIGQIDYQKISFVGCAISQCFITGAYRLPPDFQLSISTFQDVCTLNCTLIGQEVMIRKASIYWSR